MRLILAYEVSDYKTPMSGIQLIHLYFFFNQMIQLIFSAVWVVAVLGATTSPLVSNTQKLNGNYSQYDFEVPFTIPFQSSSVSLALSMVDYSQTFNSSFKIFFLLQEDTPTSSNATHAVFRAEIGLYSLTSRAKVKYLGCLTSKLSQNFNMVTSHLSLTSLAGDGYYYHTLSTPLNKTNGYSFAIWLSGIEAWKSSAGNQFYIYSDFTSANQIMLWNYLSSPMYFGSIGVTLIFMNTVASTISGTYKLPYYKQFTNTNTFPYSLSSFSSWWDTTNIICGIRLMYFSSNFYEYTFLHEGNKVNLQTTLSGPDTWQTYNKCLMAGEKMCPTTFPYYDTSTNLCYDSCSGINITSYLCSPAFVCPPNCKFCSSNTVCTTCLWGYYLRSDNLCYSSCLAGIVPESNVCCPTGCSTCTSLNVCQTCLYSFSLMSDNLCGCSSGLYLNADDQCSCFIGSPVIGGCTQVQGCLEVMFTGNGQGPCIACNQELVYGNDSCLCSQSGQVIVNGDCYPSIAGCIFYQVISGQARCQFCSFNHHFSLNSTLQTCTCKQGYTSLGQSCLELCGDGIIFEAECDDGNTLNGDGCSSQCQIQTDYRCEVSSGPSSCTYIRKGIQASLVSIKRIGQTNEVVFTFILSPNPLTYFTFAKASHPFSLILEDSTIMDLAWAYTDGKLTAKGPFSFSIQGVNAMANFTFNQKYVENVPIFLNFTIESNSIKLEFIEDTFKVVTFNKVMLGFSCASLLLLLVGSFLHKMVGVQFLHTLQLLYYLHFALKDYTITMSSLQSLSLTAFNNLYWQTENQNLQTKGEYQKVDFSIEYTELTIVFLAVPVLLAILGSIIYRLVKLYCQKSQESQGEGQHLIANIRKRLYHAFVFPFVLGFLAPFILAHFTLIMTSQPSKFSPHSVISFLSLVIAAGTSVVLGIQYLRVPFKSLKEGFGLAKSSYIPVYCLYWIAMTLLLWGWLSLGFSFSLIPMQILTVLMVLFLVFCRPYKGAMDTIGSIVNILLQLSFLLMVMLRNLGVFPSSYEIDVILCLIITILCGCCFIFSVVRVILGFCSLKEKEEMLAVKKKGKLNKGNIKLKGSAKENLGRMIPFFKINVNNQSIKQGLMDENNILQQQEFKKEKKIDYQLMEMIEKKKNAFRRKTKILEKARVQQKR